MSQTAAERKEFLQFRAPLADVRALDQLAEETAVSHSEHLRKALRHYLAQTDRHSPGVPEAAPAPTAGNRILVVENQTLVRELLAFACRQMLPAAEVRSVGSAADALQACRECPFDLILLDLVLSDGDALDHLAEIFAAAPSIKVIALSSHINAFTLHRALKARVHGVVDKNEQPVPILRQAILAVLAGRQFISTRAQRVQSATKQDPISFDKVLSDREQEVLRLIGQGCTNEQVAEKLKISVATARNHRLNIMANLDIHSAPQLIRYAIDKGFANLPEEPAAG